MDIEVKDLCKRFGEKTVFERLSLTFPQGRPSCIMGQSGRGKTTLLNLLMGLLKPDGGTIRGVPARRAAVFQEYRLCEDLTVLRNLRFAAGVRDGALAERHLAQLGLADSAGTPVRDLSGGMKQRVCLARAVLAESEILFLDEPFKGLDEGTRASAIEYVKRHTAGKTVLLVSHDPAEAAAMGAAVVRLEEAER